jgi:hyperosmotically inducible protein
MLVGRASQSNDERDKKRSRDRETLRLQGTNMQSRLLSKLWRSLGKASLAAAAMVAVASLSTLSTHARADSMPDAWITTKVKSTLLTTDGVSAAKVHVDTIDGLVTLYGSVPTAAERAKAEQAARGVEGMRDVRNLLQVVSAPTEKIVAITDEGLEKRVSATLAADPALADSSINVKSVNKGVVLLSGSAKTLSDHVRALEDARRVDGVQRVASEIQSPNTFADSEIWRDGKYDPTLSERSAASDMWITSDVKVRLLASDKTPGFDINVDTENGKVTLFGVVDSQAAKEAATAEARKVDGVKSVANELQVVPPGKQTAVAEKDEAIQDAVAKRLKANSQLSDAHITIEVKNGIARLTGDVQNQGDRLTALTVTRATRGVRGLVDDLKLQPPKVSSR